MWSNVRIHAIFFLLYTKRKLNGKLRQQKIPLIIILSQDTRITVSLSQSPESGCSPPSVGKMTVGILDEAPEYVQMKWIFYLNAECWFFRVFIDDSVDVSTWFYNDCVVYECWFCEFRKFPILFSFWTVHLFCFWTTYWFIYPRLLFSM